MNEIPNEILMNILEYITPKERNELKHIHSKWRKTVNNTITNLTITDSKYEKKKQLKSIIKE
jgi:hypothetical protein